MKKRNNPFMIWTVTAHYYKDEKFENVCEEFFKINKGRDGIDVIRVSDAYPAYDSGVLTYTFTIYLIRGKENETEKIDQGREDGIDEGRDLLEVQKEIEESVQGERVPKLQPSLQSKIIISLSDVLSAVRILINRLDTSNFTLDEVNLIDGLLDWHRKWKGVYLGTKKNNKRA